MAWGSAPVQSGQDVGTTSVAATFTLTAVASGDIILAWAGNGTNTTLPVVSDNHNGTYTVIKSMTTVVTGQCMALYGVVNGATQSCTLTTDNIGAKNWLNGSQWSGGPATLTGILGASDSQGNNTVAATESPVPSITSTNAGSLLVAAVFLNGGAGANTTVDNSFTKNQQNPNTTSWALADAYRVPGSTVTVNPKFTWTNTRKFQAITVELLPGTTTTTQTQAGKANIQKTTTQTVLGKSRITATTTQTQPGKARITVTTSQTVQGKSRITVTTPRTQPGRARITVTTSQTIQGKASIGTTVTTTQTQPGKSRIAVTTTQTQAGKSRVTATSSQAQLGKSSIKTTTSQTVQGRARIGLISSQTILGKSRLTITTVRTMLGKARITVVTSQLQLGKASILRTVTKTQLGKASLVLLTTRTQPGKARVTAVTARTQRGRARIIGGAGPWFPIAGGSQGFGAINPNVDGTWIPVPGSGGAWQ